MSSGIAISLCTSRRNAWFHLCLIDAEERSEVLVPTCDRYNSSRHLVPEQLLILGSPVDGVSSAPSQALAKNSSSESLHPESRPIFLTRTAHGNLAAWR
jgi:hypothetical protein